MRSWAMTAWASQSSVSLKLARGDVFEPCSLLRVFDGGFSLDSLIFCEIRYHAATSHTKSQSVDVLENSATRGRVPHEAARALPTALADTSSVSRNSVTARAGEPFRSTQPVQIIPAVCVRSEPLK